MLSRAALGGIWAYQRYLSPRKGWRCAHAVLHGGTGCSGYAKQAIRDRGLGAALPAIRARFRDCKAAHGVLLARRAPHDDEPGDGDADRDGRPDARRRGGRCIKRETCVDAACDGCGLPYACGLFGRAPRAAGGGGAKSLDLNPCDGDVGCGDCSVDVCSCG